jgi:GTP-binding protein HflX
LISSELARHLSELSFETGRQLGVLVSRKGEIEWVVVGESGRLVLPDIGRARAGQSRLRGLRLVHTHLKGEPLTRDDLTDLALLRLDAVAAIAVSPEGLPGQVYAARLLPANTQGQLWELETFRSIHDADPDWMAGVLSLERELAAQARARPVQGAGRAVLVAVGTHGRAEAESRLAELRDLCATAGLEVADVVLQLRRGLDPRYLIGRGKLQEVVLRSMQQLADVLIFDRDLTPAQARAIADDTSLKIVDRTQLILDIFAQRANSRDGKLQVELAQLRYRLPRLQGKGDSLSRLAGGIGGRGPGETKLEIDRRRVRERIGRLEREIDQLSKVRSVRRQGRRRQALPTLALVGYTNAGKSTLLNALTEGQALTADQLFSTLDPKSRRLRFPEERQVIITDTVGFLRELPRELVAAFRATLEELHEADLLLLVLDAADPEHEQKLAAVEQLLASLGLSAKRRVLCLNKADLLPPFQALALARRLEGLPISAEQRTGLGPLLARVEAEMFSGDLPGPRAIDALGDSEPGESDALGDQVQAALS